MRPIEFFLIEFCRICENCKIWIFSNTSIDSVDSIEFNEEKKKIVNRFDFQTLSLSDKTFYYWNLPLNVYYM